MAKPTDEELTANNRRKAGLRGFDPDVKEFEIFDFFTLEEAKNSLFTSTRSNPIPVFLKRESDNSDRIPVVIDLIKPIYNTELIGEEDYPDWYFEGWVLPSGYIPEAKFQRARMYVFTLGEGEFVDGDYLHWQWIEEPAPAVPLDASLQKLGINGRGFYLLSSEGIATLGDIIEFAKRHEFREIQGFGPGLLATLKKKMAAAGYDLP